MNDNLDDFSLQNEEQSLDSGFVIAPRDESVSIITDEFEASISTSSSEDTPLAQIIGRFNFFGKGTRERKNSSQKSFDPSTISGNDMFLDNPEYDEGIVVENPPEFDIGDMGEEPSQPSKLPANKRRNRIPNGAIDLGLGPPRETIDFTKDDVREMTYGRRIALSLMSNGCYNPRVKKIEPMRKLESNLSLSNGKTNERRNKSPSLERAWAHFEHVTLPRHVTDGKPIGNFAQRFLNRVKLLNARLEKAEPGERYLPTKLYDPFFTPLDQLGDFGLGFGLYFSTLRAVALVTLIAGLVSLPNILYFMSDKYSRGQEGVHPLLKGSAMCTDVEWVPCLDCTEDMFTKDSYRYFSETTKDGDTISFAMKNNCEGATLQNGIYSLATMVVVILGLFGTGIYLKGKEIEFDEDEQTASDYSIVIKNPPSDAADTGEWKEFFHKAFGVYVSMCTVVMDNIPLVEKLVERRELQQEINTKMGPSVSLELDNLENLASEERSKRGIIQKTIAKIRRGVPEIVKRIETVEDEIRELASKEVKTKMVFVTFETEAAQRKVLSVMKSNQGLTKKYCFRGEFLDVEEPPEPSSVRWKNLDDNLNKVFESMILPNLVCIALIVGAAYLVRHITDTYGSSAAAITISLLNLSIPRIAQFLTEREIHVTEGTWQTSLFVKICIFRWVNTAIVTSVITPLTATLTTGSGYLLTQVYSIFFSEIITISIIQLADIGGNISRHYLAPRAQTQEDMNQCMEGGVIQIAERYTNMTKILFLALWYCSIYPAALFLCSFALFVNFYVDRISLMRSWAAAPKLGSAISRMNRTIFMPAAIGFMVVNTAYTWTRFSFDNLCEEESPTDSPFFGEHPGLNITVGQDSKFYKYCSQDIGVTGSPMRFPSLSSNQPSDSKWMTKDQERISDILSWFSVAVLIVILAHYLLTIYRRLTRSYKPQGNDKGITFTDSGTAAYIPQWKSPEIGFPLLSCPVDLIQDNLFEWNSPYHDYDYYDLTLDADAIMMRDTKGRSLTSNAFNRVVLYGN